MGVSGCGKTAVGERVAGPLGLRFVDADDHHPEANRRRMAAGEPLDDDDRAPWLERLVTLLGDAHGDGEPIVLACSALKQRYRDTLRSAAPLRFVLLDVPRAVALERVGGRESHYMPTSLVDSQFQALERPIDALVVDAVPPLDEVVAATVATVLVDRAAEQQLPDLLRVIGRVRSPLRESGDAPRQRHGAPAAQVVVAKRYSDALADVAVGDELLLLTWLDRADRHVQEVHPGGDDSRPLRGVFSTRSPARPNPIGVHPVTVTAVEGTTVTVANLEALDGTPVLDLKSRLASRDTTDGPLPDA